jgi:Na+/proline symporter
MRDRWTLLIAGGCLGSVVGVIGASISDPEVGFPAWVDLTGVVAGFGLGVLTTVLVALLRHAMWSSRRKHQRKDVHAEELRPRV